jgi:hypothetical protein
VENPVTAIPERIGVAGDWHGNTAWATRAVRKMARQLPAGPRIIVHLGDFGIWPGRDGRDYLTAVTGALAAADAELWFVDGNHEDFSQLARLRPGPDGREPVTERIWHLPRGYRWRWHGRVWLALGGAVSVDRALRIPGVDWWPEEEITADQKRNVISGGYADVMLTHDCFARETLVASRSGFVPIGALADQEVELLTENRGGKGDAVWVHAKVYSRGVQQLYRVTVQRNGLAKQLFATSGHRWATTGNYRVQRRNRLVRCTTDLQPGDRLARAMKKNFGSSALSPVGVMAGIVYGDGTIRGDSANIDLYGDSRPLISWFPGFPYRELVDRKGEQFYQVYCLPQFFRKLPPHDEARSYLAGWLAGYIAADGHVAKRSGSVVLYSSDLASLEFARCVALTLGLGIGDIRDRLIRGYGEPCRGYVLSFWRETFPASMLIRSDHREAFDRAAEPQRQDWIVRSVEPTSRVEEVFCPVVPTTETFVIEGHILTGNCPAGVPHTFPPPPRQWAAADLRRSEAHRGLLREIVLSVEPRWLMHGHLHMGYQRTVDLGRGPVEITGLDRDGAEHSNWAILDVAGMRWLRFQGKPISNAIRSLVSPD